MDENLGITAVLGASLNPTRALHMAVARLVSHGYAVSAIDIRKGEICGVEIETGRPEIKKVHTLTLYTGQKNLGDWQDYALGLVPNRIIFNSGTENPKFEAEARKAGIEVEHACTLVRISTNSY